MISLATTITTLRGSDLAVAEGGGGTLSTFPGGVGDRSKTHAREAEFRLALDRYIAGYRQHCAPATGGSRRRRFLFFPG